MVLIIHLSFLFALPLIDCVKKAEWDTEVEQTLIRPCNAESYQNMGVPYNIFSRLCPDSEISYLKIIFTHPKKVISFFRRLPSLSDWSWLL